MNKNNLKLNINNNKKTNDLNEKFYNSEIEKLKKINIKKILSYYFQKLNEKNQLENELKSEKLIENKSISSLSETSKEINSQTIIGKNKQLNEDNQKLKNQLEELKNKKNDILIKYSQDIDFFSKIITKINTINNNI